MIINNVATKGVPVITAQDFAGIGTRELLPIGEAAIRSVYEKTFSGIE